MGSEKIVATFYIGSDDEGDDCAAPTRRCTRKWCHVLSYVSVWAGCRVSRWHAGRLPSEVVETEVLSAGQESSEAEASQAADCAFCVDCEHSPWPIWMLDMRGPVP